MDYTNSAVIIDNAYSASAVASTFNTSEESNFVDSVNIISEKGYQGASLSADNAKNMEYSRNLGGGKTDVVSFTYSLIAGEDPASLKKTVSNPSTCFSDQVYNLINNSYSGKLQAFDNKFVTSGRGNFTGNGPSGLEESIQLRFGDKSCTIDSYLDGGSVPLNYSWITSAGQVEIARVRTSIFSIMPNALLFIYGTSSHLDDVSAPITGPDAVPYAFMEYRLNSTGVSIQKLNE